VDILIAAVAPGDEEGADEVQNIVARLGRSGALCRGDVEQLEVTWASGGFRWRQLR
jgi:hypothetical protein